MLHCYRNGAVGILAGAILVVLHIAFSASAFAANDARDRHITSAATRPESITVVVASDYPPYSIGSGAALQGILKDNWDLWSARTGITVNLQAIDWAEAQQAVLEGRADVIDMFFLLPSAHRSTTTPSRLRAFKRRCFFTAASAELSTRTRCRALRSA